MVSITQLVGKVSFCFFAAKRGYEIAVDDDRLPYLECATHINVLINRRFTYIEQNTELLYIQ